MQTIERQRAIRRILSDALRLKAHAKVDYVFSHHVRYHVDAEVVNGGPISIKMLKDHLRSVCNWLEWIEAGRDPLAVRHAIRQTRNVGGNVQAQ